MIGYIRRTHNFLVMLYLLKPATTNFESGASVIAIITKIKYARYLMTRKSKLNEEKKKNVIFKGLKLIKCEKKG